MNRTFFYFSVLLLLFSCSHEKKQEIHNQQNNKPRVADSNSLGKAPDFRKVTFKGEAVKLTDFRGKVVLLNFWATWCGPCRREIPALIEIQNELGDDGLQVIGIALDEEGFQVVQPYVREQDINYPVLLDDYSYGNELGGIYVIPTTYIIDRNGNIVARRIGETTADEFRSLVKEIL